MVYRQHELIEYPIESSKKGGAKPKKIDVRRERILEGENSGRTREDPVCKIARK